MSAPFDRTSFSTELRPTHVALTAVPLCILGVVLIFACIWRAMQRTFRLAVVLIVLVAAALLCVGLVVWCVTYISSRDSIQDAKIEHLTSQAGEAVEKLHRELHPGVAFVDTMHEMMEAGAVDPTNTTYPEAHLFIDRLALSFIVPLSRSVRSVYYGTKDGHYLGGHIAKPIGTTVRLSGTGETFPSWSNCPYELSPQDCSNHITSGNCGDNSTTDALCSKACGKGVSYTWTVYMERDTNTFDGGHVSRGYKQGDTSGECDVYFFDPRTRPWYKVKDLTWSVVYAYESLLPTVGITVSRGFFSPDGTQLATIATDYDMTSLAPLMQEMLPSEHSVAVLLQADATVIAVSLDAAELHEDMGRVKILNEILNVQTTENWREDSRIKETVRRLYDRYGSLAGLMDIRALLLHEDDVVMTVPLRIRGGLDMVLVVTVPYEDIMGEADDASALALCLAIGIIFVSSAFVLGMVTLILLPITRLQSDMYRVAHMDLDRITDVTTASSISEMAVMQKSFHSMVLRLAEYRNYIPLSVLPTMEEGDSTESHEPSIGVPGRDKESSTNKGSANHSLHHSGANPATVMSQTLRTQRVTLVVGNIREFGVLVKTKSSADLQQLHELYIEVLHTLSQKLRGIVEEFCGDRVTVSFNGAFQCVQHDVNGLRFCRSVLARDSPMPKELKVNTAATCGKLLCGSMGCRGLKRFTYVGRPLNCVYTIERYGASWGVPMLVGQGFNDDMSHTSTLFEMRRIARIEVGATVDYMCEVLGELSYEHGEWMYQLENNDSGYRAYNAVVEALYEGDYDTAEAKIEETREKRTNVRHLPKWLAQCRREGKPKPLNPQDRCTSEEVATMNMQATICDIE